MASTSVPHLAVTGRKNAYLAQIFPALFTHRVTSTDFFNILKNLVRCVVEHPPTRNIFFWEKAESKMDPLRAELTL